MDKGKIVAYTFYMFSLLSGLLLGAISVIFVLQNVFSVTVTFFAWTITAPLAVIISASILMGILAALVVTLPESISNSFTISRLQKENKKLKDEKLVKVVEVVEVESRSEDKVI